VTARHGTTDLASIVAVGKLVKSFTLQLKKFEKAYLEKAYLTAFCFLASF